MKVPHLHITALTGQREAVEAILAILVADGRVTLSGEIGDHINRHADELKALPNPKEGDTV